MKFIANPLSSDQKIKVLDMAPTPEGWNQSDFLCAKREMKKIINGKLSGKIKDYPKEFMFLNDLLKSVEEKAQVAPNE